MKKNILAVVATLVAWTGAFAIDVRIVPEIPTIRDVLRIEIHGATQPGVLHWGVNADGLRWQPAHPSYQPAGSVMDGEATRTEMSGPDENGVYSVVLGPFTNKEQLVRSVNFAIQWKDGTWSNKDEKNYNIEVSYGRITWYPKKPTVNDRIVVTIHDSPGRGELRWGVNAERDLWNPPSTNYWPRGTKLADDGIAVDSPISAPDKDGASTIVLGPFNRAEDLVRTVHMAVHWGDVWDTDAARNYNMEIALNSGEGSPEVAFLSPRSGEVIVESPQVVLEADRAEAVDMWLNGRPVATIREAPFELRIPFQQLKYGRHVLTARAKQGLQVGLDEVEFWRVPPHVVEALPESTPWGTTVHDDGTVTFTLHAPGKRFVSLVGDFNDWNPFADMMKSSPDGTWWIRRPIPNGVHEYQFCVEGYLFVSDPYARDVTWKDKRGRETHRPEDAKSILRVGQPEYQWTSDGYQRPPLEKLFVYEFHIDDMHPGGGYTNVIAKLDYIKDLGFTAIGPMPVTEFPMGSSWGYNPAFHFAPESVYGTPDDLKRLIDEAHKRGLAYVADLVLNHMDKNGTIYQLYGSDYEASPFFRKFTGENWGFPDLEQQSRAFKRYAADVVQYWIREFRTDAIRYDATRFVEWSGYNDWGGGWLAYAAKQADPSAIQIAEHIPPDPEFINQTEMDTTWDSTFRWDMRPMIDHAYLDRGRFERLMDARLQGYTNNFQRMVYTESHDEERVVFTLREAGFKEDEIFRRATMAYALTILAPGATMIYGGQEFGEDTKKVVGHNPMQWNKLRRAPNKALYEAARALGRLRVTHPVMTVDTVTVQNDGLPEHVAAFYRETAGEAVVCAANFGRTRETAVVRLPFAGTWTGVVNGRDLPKADAAEYKVRLEPGEVVVITGKAAASN